MKVTSLSLSKLYIMIWLELLPVMILTCSVVEGGSESLLEILISWHSTSSK